jgi:hypothetical protein
MNNISGIAKDRISLIQRRSMRIARLAAAMTAAGVLVLAGAGTALATDTTPEPTPTVTETATDTASPTPTDEPTEPEIPDFDAAFTPDTFRPGDTLTLHTIGCPEKPDVEDIDGLFASPIGLEQVDEFEHQGSAATKSNLPNGKTFRVLVGCKDRGAFLFTFSQGKKTQKQHKGQTGVTPVGGVDTGDGSSLMSGGSAVLPVVAGASAVVLAGGFGLMYRRRKAREDA